MKLYFLGHSERYAIEQLQMQLFPDDPPEVCDEPFKGDGMISALFRGKTWDTATTCRMDTPVNCAHRILG